MFSLITTALAKIIKMTMICLTLSFSLCLIIESMEGQNGYQDWIVKSILCKSYEPLTSFTKLTEIFPSKAIKAGQIILVLTFGNTKLIPQLHWHCCKRKSMQEVLACCPEIIIYNKPRCLLSRYAPFPSLACACSNIMRLSP